MPAAILFDWDNTLVDTWPVIHEALRQTFIDMNHEPWSLQETKEKVHRSMRDYFPELFGSEWEEAAEIYMQYFRSMHLEKLTPLPEAEEVLKLLNSKDIFLAVVSNKTNINLRKEVKHIGWEKYFKRIVGAKDAPKDKPHPDPVHVALDGTDVKINEHLWFVGDSITDMECAYNVGCTPVFFGNPKQLEQQQYENYQPQKIFKNHNELIAFFK